MPLYDCMLMLKSQVEKKTMMELVARVAKHVYKRNGVITEIRSFGKVNLGYGIKKLDGRHFQAQLMQMTMMAPPSIKEELRYLNKEDRLLRWIFIKNRGVILGENNTEDDDKRNPLMLHSNIYSDAEDEDEDDDEDDEVEQRS